MRQKIRGFDLRKGDVILNEAGQPYFRVSKKHYAKAPGHLILDGEYLVKRFGDQSDRYYTHKDNVLNVERES